MKVAVGHSPEGRGHATRMLAVAERLAARGHDVSVAGGGPGERLVALNGFEEAPLTEVDFSNAAGFVAVARELVRGGRRLVDAARWLRREAPDRVVADDAFVALAAVRLGLDCYVVTHTAASLFDGRRERAATRLANAVLPAVATAVLCPRVPGSDLAVPRGATAVPPMAMDGRTDGMRTDGASDSREAGGTDGAAAPPADPPPDDVGVLVVPSAYSESMDAVVRRLRDRRAVTVAPGTRRSLFPTLAAADAVVCGGYSTVMEAAVAGTPCVVVPETPEQRGVARAVASAAGFRTAGSPDGVVEALADVGEPDPAENGAEVVATIVER